MPRPKPLRMRLMKPTAIRAEGTPSLVAIHPCHLLMHPSLHALHPRQRVSRPIPKVLLGNAPLIPVTPRLIPLFLVPALVRVPLALRVGRPAVQPRILGVVGAGGGRVGAARAGHALDRAADVQLLALGLGGPVVGRAGAAARLRPQEGAQGADAG